MIAERRPQVTTTSGQGGRRPSPLDSSIPASTPGQPAGNHRCGQRTLTTFSTTVSATAAARPRAWVRMPASPVVIAQAVSGKGREGLAKDGIACVAEGRGSWGRARTADLRVMNPPL